MGDVAVSVVRAVPVLCPLLELSPASYLARCQLRYTLAVMGCEGVILAESLRCLGYDAEDFGTQLVVHGHARGYVLHALVGRMRVLWRHGGADDHMPGVGVSDEDIVEECCRALHDGVVLAEETLVSCEEVMVPEMVGEPCAACHPEARRGMVDRACYAPDVCVMVEHPSSRAVHGRGCLGSCCADIAYEAPQRLVHLHEVGDIGRPVVHLEVDVTGILRVPRGQQLVVPYSLEVGCLSAGL